MPLSVKLTIAAGTFDAVRLEGSITMINNRGVMTGKATIWYSKDHRRLLKQIAEIRHERMKFDETLELSAIHRAPR